MLHAAGANIEAIDVEGYTPMFAAAMEGCGEVVGELLAAGGVKEVRDSMGQTMLHVAAEHGHAGVVQVSANRGVDCPGQVLVLGPGRFRTGESS